MHPLDERSRRRLFTCAALLCAVPVCLAPLAGRSSLEIANERAAFDTRFQSPALAVTWSARPVTVLRDPFAARGAVNTPAAARVIGMHVTQGQPIGYTAPASNEQGAATVTAVVSGASPRALVDDGARVRVVRVGDMLGGLRIVGIGEPGVRLQNGTLIPLGGGAP